MYMFLASEFFGSNTLKFRCRKLGHFNGRLLQKSNFSFTWEKVSKSLFRIAFQSVKCSFFSKRINLEAEPNSKKIAWLDSTHVYIHMWIYMAIAYYSLQYYSLYAESEIWVIWVAGGGVYGLLESIHYRSLQVSHPTSATTTKLFPQGFKSVPLVKLFEICWNRKSQTVCNR